MIDPTPRSSKQLMFIPDNFSGKNDKSSKTSVVEKDEIIKKFHWGKCSGKLMNLLDVQHLNSSGKL